MDNQRYAQRGVSAEKEDIHNAIKNLDKGLYPNAFCIAHDELSAVLIDTTFQFCRDVLHPLVEEFLLASVAVSALGAEDSALVVVDYGGCYFYAFHWGFIMAL